MEAGTDVLRRGNPSTPDESSRCPVGGNVRISGVSCRIERPHAIAIPRLGSQPSVGKTRRVYSDLSNLHKVCAAIALAALDLKTVLVSGIIRPRWINLTS